MLLLRSNRSVRIASSPFLNLSVRLLLLRFSKVPAKGFSKVPAPVLFLLFRNWPCLLFQVIYVFWFTFITNFLLFHSYCCMRCDCDSSWRLAFCYLLEYLLFHFLIFFKNFYFTFIYFLWSFMYFTFGYWMGEVSTWLSQNVMVLCGCPCYLRFLTVGVVLSFIPCVACNY
jgi:hypothetical protein